MLRMLKLADLFTLANLLSGALAVFMVIDQRPGIAVALLILALLFDLIDGKVARWRASQNLFGKQLDSLADVVSFGMAPAALAYTLAPRGVLTLLALLFFVGCGMLRLARFNITRIKGYQGLPITNNAWIAALLYLLTETLPTLSFLWPVILAASGVLMVSSIRIRKVF